jgi:hypothetical protein
MNKYEILSGSWLKVIAMVTMTIDHMAVFLPYFHEHPTLYFAMRTIGRVAFIIFAFLLSEGFIHTRDKRIYGRNLAVFAIISQLPYSLIHNHFLFYSHTNVGFTLLLAFLGMLAMEHYKEEKIKLIAILATIIIVTLLVKPVRSFAGVGLVWVFYLLRSYPISRLFVGFCMIARNYVFGQMLGFAVLGLYNGQRGFIKGSIGKYAFYVFYPLHLLILWGIRTFL